MREFDEVIAKWYPEKRDKKTQDGDEGDAQCTLKTFFPSFTATTKPEEETRRLNDIIVKWNQANKHTTNSTWGE